MGAASPRTYDGNYGIEALASSAADGLNLDFGLDVLGNIVSITPTVAGGPEQARVYVYDPVDRLSEVRDANQALIGKDQDTHDWQ